jgi:hypothetical protein
MRNVGGHVLPALTDIVTLDSFVRIDEIMIVHHTGMFPNLVSSLTH